MMIAWVMKGYAVSMLNLIADPKVFNYVILTLYVMNAARWGWHGSWADVSYWLSAFAITATVTWGYGR
jgi:hypothetical protein